MHHGPGFLPWHRELRNRLEASLREVDPELSLQYWDWTTDPRESDNGAGGTTNLFTPQFMGSAAGDAGYPFQNFESSEGVNHTKIWRDVSAGAPPIPSDQSIGTNGDTPSQADQFLQMIAALQGGNHLLTAT
ncbi:MAG: tyrosinase family protein [Actinomycetota bacterium]|nr:tyrosinase family protein [Actinomycetota bacterium]